MKLAEGAKRMTTVGQAHNEMNEDEWKKLYKTSGDIVDFSPTHFGTANADAQVWAWIDEVLARLDADGRRIADLEKEDEKKKRDIQYLTAKRVELEDERDIFKRTLDKRDARNAELEADVGAAAWILEWMVADKYRKPDVPEIIKRKRFEVRAREKRIAELEAELRKRGSWHLPGCRKMMYDISSSPCTCESSFNEVVSISLEKDKRIAELERLASILNRSSI